MYGRVERPPIQSDPKLHPKLSRSYNVQHSSQTKLSLGSGRVIFSTPSIQTSSIRRRYYDRKPASHPTQTLFKRSIASLLPISPTNPSKETWPTFKSRSRSSKCGFGCQREGDTATEDPNAENQATRARTTRARVNGTKRTCCFPCKILYCFYHEPRNG
jgi:hypothetical protein